MNLFRLLGCFALGVCLLAQSHSKQDEAAARQMVQKYMDARDRQDPRAIESLFTPDADQLVSSGEWRKGRADVVKGTMASSQATGGKRTVTIESLRFLGADTALADGRYDLTGLAGGQDRHMWTSIVLVKTVGSSRVDLQACKLEYSIVSPK